MTVIYRNMLPEDEQAVFELRMRTWGNPPEEVRQRGYSDPLYLRRTYVALERDGTLLSTVRYWLRQIRDAGGTPRLVGCVASVVTIEAARRQGHAGKLMQLAISSMRDEGCDWSLLFSSSMGVPLYESLGYRLYSAPYFRGTFAGNQQTSGGTSSTAETNDRCDDQVIVGMAGKAESYFVTRTDGPFDLADRDWRAVCHIYAAYNAERPLSLLRDEDYWRGYFSQSLSTALRHGTLSLFLASDEAQPVAYLLARMLSVEAARDYFNEDRGFIISEVGILPGHEAAFPALLAAVQRELLLPLVTQQSQPLESFGLSQMPQATWSSPWELSGAAFLPRQAAVEQALRSMFGETLRITGERRRMMGLPLRKDFSESDLTLAFETPGALFWPLDSF